jgi:hypothetical protein
MKRFKLSKRKSNKIFKRGARINKRNIKPRGQRGGTRI